MMSFKSYVLAIVLMISTLLYYLYEVNKIPAQIAEATETIVNVDKIRFTFKVSNLSQKALFSYQRSLSLQNEDLAYDALDIFDAAIAFMHITYTKNEALIAYVEPRIVESKRLIEEHLFDNDEQTMIRLVYLNEEISKYLELHEKETWEGIQNNYIEFQTDEKKSITLYQSMMFLFLFFSILLIVMFVRQFRLKKETQTLKERLRYAADNILAGYWEWDLSTNGIYLSDGWKKFLGYDSNELINAYSTFIDNLHEDDTEGVLQVVDEYLTGKRSSYEAIFRMRHKDGTYSWVKAKGMKIKEKERELFFGFYIDIDELIRARELLIAQSRHAAMGEMIGMIAHQWRQPLSVISMQANNMLLDIELETKSDEDFKEYIESIGKQTQYLSQTIDDFRNFFRKDKAKKDFIVKQIVQDAIEMMGKSFEYNAIAIKIGGDSEASAYAYPSEFLQVILNLLKNAKEALETGSQKEKQIEISIAKDEGNIIIKTCDNAGGVDEHILDKIFEPYFTTKEVLNGTGIGLYMSKTIIEDHFKGSLRVFNNEHGACFEIVIPSSLP